MNKYLVIKELEDKGMIRMEEKDWTDGSGKALSKVASVLNKQESAKQDKDKEYFSNPRLYIQDLNTGAAMMVIPEEHEGGKTKGYGYRKCRPVMQRVAHKVPPKLQQAVLLDMLVGMLVPKDEDRVGPLAEAAYKRIGEAMIEAQQADDWLKEKAKHSDKVNEVIEKIQDMTWTERKGDTLLKVDIIPLDSAKMVGLSPTLDIKGELKE
jgi:ribosomal protein S16|tara:strand:+ start:1014 stop:1640 length:627 start_codon:yes stop_codon:yes gene_type:complete